MSDVSPIITGTGLFKTFQTGFIIRNSVHAIEGVDISIHPGETYALVGESGSGKSTLGKLLLMLSKPTKGEIRYHGEDISQKSDTELSEVRQKLQIIPQHPEDALNPRWKLKRSILEPYEVNHNMFFSGSQDEKISELLSQTGLNPDYANRYPHQLSGGELQRAIIARTISLNPDFLVCDEPTSMLDVSIQASIIHLLKDIQQKSKLALLFITHDIRIAKIVGDTTGVMFRGQIIEEGSDVINHPLHPYTRSLTLGGKKNEDNKTRIEGGCPYLHECIYKQERCRTLPPLIRYKGRLIRCHYPDALT